MTDAPATVCEMFDIRLERDPDAVVLLTPDGVGRTYAQLADRAAALARTLRARGVGRGDTVGLYLWNDPAWVVAILGAWWCGCSIAACGALSPPPEADRRFRLVGPTVVVAADDLEAPSGWDVIRVSGEGVPVGSAGVGPGPPGAASGAAGSSVATAEAGSPVRPFDLDRPGPDELAAVFFTSGTTGEAKPIGHTHRKLAAGPRTTAAAYARTPEFRPRTAPPDKPPALSFNPFGHMAGLGRLIFRIYVGRTLLLVPKFEVAVMGALAERYPLDTLQLTPAMVHALAFTDADVKLGSLRYVTSGTAPLPIATRDVFERRYGVPVLQAYGSTEGGVTALERYEDALAGRRGPGSVGRVAADCPLRIVDHEGHDLPVGGDGEILGRPERAASARYLTSSGQEPVPVDADGWYHTGDVGHLDEHGILYITGRLKEMMIVGGFNVYPAEVEDALRASPLVRDAVVVPVPDDRLGEVPIAGIVWSDPADPEATFARLAGECRERLEAYKVPRQWFTLERLPLTPNGKLDRRRAAELGSAATA